MVRKYLYIPISIAAEINGRLYAIHTDQLNTPRQLTDENGHKVWQWGISGFGEVEATTAETGWIRARNGSAGQRSHTQPITFNLRFPGQQFDEESGLHYNHHRYYDPYLTVGYTEADPLGLQAGWNRFLYAEGDAFGYSDAEGLIAQAIPLVGTFVIRVCASAASKISAALTGLAAGAAIVEAVDCSENQCEEEEACDPPAGTVCSVYHSEGTPHSTTDADGNFLGKIIPHVHTYQQNKKPDGKCEWNIRRGSEHTHNFTPINARPCYEYPSWLKKYGRN